MPQRRICRRTAGEQLLDRSAIGQAFNDLVYLIDPGRPDSSRFLHKPLHPDAGGDLMHNGGRRWFSKDDPERVALEDWVNGNASGSQCPPALQFDYPPRA